MGVVRNAPLEVLDAPQIANYSALSSLADSDASGSWVWVATGVVLVAVMALVLLAAVSYQCSATWRWLKAHALDLDDSMHDNMAKQAAIRISHSLPDLNTEPVRQEYVQENKESKKVLRQTTLPSVPTRHQTFQRQLSHRLDPLEPIQFSVCSLEPKTDSLLGLIKPEMYQKEGIMRQGSSDSSGTAEMEYCGKLHFALRYDSEIEGLVVKVLEARDLPIKDVMGSSDPYVKVHLLPDRKKKFQTKVHRKNLNPVFNETFIFSVAYEELRHRYVQFSVYDFDRFSRHDLIGQVVLKGLLDYSDLHQEIEHTMTILCAPQVSQLQMQVFSLTQLLRGEIGRGARTNSLIQAMMWRYDQKVDDLEDADMENGALLRAVKLFDRRYHLLEVKHRNNKNDLKGLRHERLTYEYQLSKERGKVWDLRKENKILNAKVNECEKELSEKEERILELESRVAALDCDVLNQTRLLSAVEQDTDSALLALMALKQQQQQLCVRVQEAFEYGGQPPGKLDLGVSRTGTDGTWSRRTRETVVKAVHVPAQVFSYFLQSLTAPDFPDDDENS